MNLGKSLRLRRMFSSGRALVVDSDTISLDPLNQIRHLSRAGADAVVLTPGLIRHVYEEVNDLAVILRIDAGPGKPQLLSVQAALEMGAEAVLLSMSTRSKESLENFARASEAAERLGMPLVAHVTDEDWREGATLAADFGADVIQAELPKQGAGLRQFVRITGTRVLVRVSASQPDSPEMLERIYEALQNAAQGVSVARRDITENQIFEILHGLVHQGITAGQAAAMLERSLEPRNSR